MHRTAEFSHDMYKLHKINNPEKYYKLFSPLTGKNL